MAAGTEEDPEPFSPSDFLDLPPTPCPDDDLVLPFIARMLMEEEEEEDEGIIDDVNPALLEAQQPFAEILSNNAAATSAISSTTKSFSAFAKTTWPYDPVELSQQLLLSSSRGQHQHGSSSETLPSDGGDNRRVTMEMLNQAFLKGMEEANKFLPTSNTLLIGIQATSKEHLRRANNEVSHGLPIMFQESANNGRGRKNKHHNWDDCLEAETGRSCKLMVPDMEEDSSEMLDGFIINGYQSLLDKMMEMSISTDKEAEKNTRKGKGSSNEAVDLRTLLIHCAQAVANDDRRNAAELLRKIKQGSSPRGDATQRLAHCFAKGLEARLAGTGSHVYKSLMSKGTSSSVEFYKAYQLCLAVCCFQMMAFKFSNITICKAITGRKKVHIVDYGDHYGFQWPTLLGLLATWEGGPPEVRITAIGLPQPGFRPAARIESTGNFTRQCGVPFKFRSIVAKWETICADDLNIQSDEVLIVNEALFYFSAMFDMMDAMAPRDNAERILIEQEFLGRHALNAIACEGSDRVERPETYRQWQVRTAQAGLRQLPSDPDVVKAVSKKVKDGYHKDFFIDVDQQWVLQGWKGRTLYAMSTWVANDAT
ncbi:unnamed protein product [Urochloa decumbens]|uniref:Uncharacterized protein n=1 Tax=Urochloa decumbens TaxID=240449 RepID=A0ABC9H6K9_9POAL